MAKLEYLIDGSGCKLLLGKTYHKQQFYDLEIPTSPYRDIVRIENCQFVDCVTSPGTCVIGDGVSLDTVLISNLDCGDAIHISSEVKMSNVIVRGGSPAALSVRPQCRDFLMPPADRTELQLDISEFLGEVVIMGMRGKTVRKDLSRHTTVFADWRQRVDWKGLGIGDSYFKICAMKLEFANLDEGVFSLPTKKSKTYEKVVKEKGILETVGIKFS